MDGFIVRLCKTMCRFLSLPRTSQTPKKEKSWIVLIDNVKCLHFWSLLYRSVLFGSVTEMGVCYLCLMWRCFDNSKHSHYSFREAVTGDDDARGSDWGWCRQPWLVIKMCCEISHARRVTHCWAWHFHGCGWWWLRIPFLDLTSAEDGGSLGSLCCLGLSCVGFPGWLHSCPRWLLFFSRTVFTECSWYSISLLLTLILTQWKTSSSIQHAWQG